MILSLQNISLGHKNNDLLIQGVSINISSPNIYYLIGEEGSGKSSILEMIFLNIKPTHGSIVLLSKNTGSLSKTQKENILSQIGYVDSKRTLVEEFTVYDNLVLQFYNQDTHSNSVIEKRALSILDGFSIRDIAYRKVKEISTTERDKVAIACAIIKRPKINIFDDPIVNMSYDSGCAFLEIFLEISKAAVKNHESVVIIATNNHKITDITPGQIIRIKDKKLIMD